MKKERVPVLAGGQLASIHPITHMARRTRLLMREVWQPITIGTVSIIGRSCFSWIRMIEGRMTRKEASKLASIGAPCTAKIRLFYLLKAKTASMTPMVSTAQSAQAMAHTNRTQARLQQISPLQRTTICRTSVLTTHQLRTTIRITTMPWCLQRCTKTPRRRAP